MSDFMLNELRINKKYASLILSDKNYVDFNILLPMPEDIQNTENDSCTRPDICYYLTEKLTIPCEEFIHDPFAAAVLADPASLRMIKDKVPAGLTPEQAVLKDEYESLLSVKAEYDPDGYARGAHYVSNYKKYGSITWYEWSCSNWGCKWNACETEVTPADGDDLLISFSTPWSEPAGWYEALMNRNIPFRSRHTDTWGNCWEAEFDGTELKTKTINAAE